MVQLKDPEKNEVSNGNVGRVSASGLGQAVGMGPEDGVEE